MSDRSNFSIIGGSSVTGENVGNGVGVFKGKTGSSNLQFKTITTTGCSLCIINSTDQIYISGNSMGGGVSPTSGFLYWDSSTNKYIPYSSKQNSLVHLYYGTQTPNNTTRINLDGSLVLPYLSVTDGDFTTEMDGESLTSFVINTNELWVSDFVCGCYGVGSDGSSIDIAAGNASDGNYCGGNLKLKAGKGFGTGDNGNVYLMVGDGGLPSKTTETNILYYNTSNYKLSRGNLTDGGNGSIQYNDNGILGGTNLYWREDVSGFTWGSGYVPSGGTIFTLHKNFDYNDDATGFLSLGVCGPSFPYVLNISYECKVLYDCVYQIQSNIPLIISSCVESTSGSSSIVVSSSQIEIDGFNCVMAKGNEMYFNAIKNTLYYEKTGIIVNQLNLLRNCYRKIIQWGTTNGTNSTRLCNGLNEEYNNSLGDYVSGCVCHVGMSFDACVNGIDGINGDSVSFFFQGLIKRPSGGTVSIVGTPSKVSYKDSALSTADANVYANNTTKTLDICVCGVTGKCMLWNAIVNSMQLVGVKYDG